MDKFFGWKPDAPDPRDAGFAFSVPEDAILQLPVEVHLTRMPPITNQGRYNSCTAHAATFAFWYAMLKQGGISFPPSRAFNYWHGRVLDGMDPRHPADDGLTIRSAMKALAQSGEPVETAWPYTGSNIKRPPTVTVNKAAIKHTALVYRSVPIDRGQIDAALFAGFPVVVGTLWYENMLTAQVDKTGLVPYPNTGHDAVGAHAVALVGYDVGRGLYEFRNSWGAGWGMSGYGAFPRNYLISKFAGDAWTLQAVL